jgi:hypothetical protein
MALLRAALLGAAYFTAFSSATDVAELGVQVVAADPAARPNFADPNIMDRALQEWKAASKRTSASLLKACPTSCSEAGISSPEQWYMYPSAARLSRCNETMFLDFSLFSRIENGNSQIGIRACTADLGISTASASIAPSSCYLYSRAAVKAPVQSISRGAATAPDATAGLLATSRQVQNYLGQQSSTLSCKTSHNIVNFAYSGSVVLGVYIGSQVSLQGISTQLLERFMEQVEKKGVMDTQIIQMCVSTDYGAEFSMGIAASSTSDLAFIREAVKTWSRIVVLPSSNPVLQPSR